MKKKKDEFYYKNLSACVEISYQAALFLRETIACYDREGLKEKLDVMQDLEQ